MAELIDRDALKAHYAWWGDTDERRAFDDIVDAQPAVEAVPVVRCKDCAKRHSIMFCPMVYYTVKGKLRLDATTDNVYCSYGIAKAEPKEDKT